MLCDLLQRPTVFFKQLTGKHMSGLVKQLLVAGAVISQATVIGAYMHGKHRGKSICPDAVEGQCSSHDRLHLIRKGPRK